MILTPREQQVFDLLASGKTYKEAGKYLGITVNTIRTRVRIFYKKLNAHTIAEAVMNYEFRRLGNLQVRLEEIKLPENHTNPKEENEIEDSERSDETRYSREHSEREKIAAVRASAEPVKGDKAESEQQGD